MKLLIVIAIIGLVFMIHAQSTRIEKLEAQLFNARICAAR